MTESLQSKLNEEIQVNSNAAVARTMADFLTNLGGIAPGRVAARPALGHATLADLMAINESNEPALHELVDGVLVEKAMGFEASVVALAIARIIGAFVAQNRLGLVSGAGGFFQLDSSVRGPDVAFVSADRLPEGVFPKEAYPKLSPNLVVEVLSPGNTQAEMTRKRLEYFHSGAQLMWIVDCTFRSVAVYTSVSEVTVLDETAMIDGGNALPGFTAPVADFFSDLDIGLPGV